jgi:hypothetical protein
MTDLELIAKQLVQSRRARLRQRRSHELAGRDIVAHRLDDLLEFSAAVRPRLPS